ncbi:hypothetical protein [Haloplasma contractile]|uniref:Uncharacterized protein n=1 Tax=Haloplasma contractile SSD-17B TaxID=1033810 RepID=F7PWY1_9MOLU|nr:hypothetical protein [Haloplasma contractile]ERJ12779.1 hypothetical protein HLPCO_001119 [Haloplasma contractile SSD-17B]
MLLVLIFSAILYIVTFITLLNKKKIGKNKFIIINAFIFFLTMCLMIYNVFIDYSMKISVTLLMGFTINHNVVEISKVWFKKMHFLLSFIIFVLFVIYTVII